MSFFAIGAQVGQERGERLRVEIPHLSRRSSSVSSESNRGLMGLYAQLFADALSAAVNGVHGNSASQEVETSLRIASRYVD